MTAIQSLPNAAKAEVVPIVLVKAHSRCNINCTYCYMYNLGDRSALQKPKRMSDQVAASSIARIIEYAQSLDVTRVQIVFHGGEPLMAGQRFFRSFLDTARLAADAAGLEFVFTVQTNGILLDDTWCRLFAENGVRLGVSIDGIPEVHDRFRVTHSGKGTYAQVRKGWTRAVEHGLDSTVLTVVDPQSCPDAVFHHLAGLKATQVDLLLPEAWHDAPPDRDGGETPHADWFIRFFELWRSQAPAPFRVPFFDRALHRLLFFDETSQAPILDERHTVIVDTDGEISCMDLLRGAVPGASNTGFFVHADRFVDAIAGNPVRQRYGNDKVLPEKCKACRLRPVCGGGAISHRFRQSNGFDNPSVYCPDLTKIFDHLHACYKHSAKIDLARLLGLFGGQSPQLSHPTPVAI